MVHDMTRALVLGGCGFVGGHLCERLLATGVEVICVDDLSTSAPTAENLLRDHAHYQFVRHDITEPLTGRAFGQPVDVVFHLASPASPADYLRLPLHTLHTGAMGTANALSAAERHGARLVLASTSEVYGDPLEHPQPETYWGNVNPIGPRSVYDEAKRYAEALTFAHRRERDTDVGVARIFNTYGPRMRSHDGRMVPTFIRQALAGEPMTVTGSGGQTRSLCYVDDTVEGLLALARSGYPGPVNIGNPHELTVNQVAEIIRDLAGADSAIEFLPAVEDDPQRRCPDIATAREHLGWEPRVPYRDGLARTVEWFRSMDPTSEYAVAQTKTAS
ncbi:dTDP-glucose 4,6-dehydratase [Mycolicibacterium litorale]|uniref:dTDP-glucose 4,6-dehydratase n=2 Tax=Mycolicibacterium litorale TaxID=758802 RepID=A0AAD1ILT3_9MYCO|nr:dTDP-glucose 4,6-dehydratase [Mycolicibacterium litorale]